MCILPVQKYSKVFEVIQMFTLPQLTKYGSLDLSMSVGRQLAIDLQWKGKKKRLRGIH
jgi:hypothetical protein